MSTIDKQRIAAVRTVPQIFCTRTRWASSVAEKFVPFFKTGKDLRERLNGNKHH